MDGMRKVGMRQLRNRLSHYVRQVRAGREIQVTNRGEVVAELVPPRRGEGQSVVVTLGLPNDPKVYRRMPRRLKRGELQRLIDEERRER
jgi:prevent-host-death family protein